MFKIKDSVIHCREGLSTIVSMNNMNGKDYFLVSVNHNSGETIYVPVETAENIIRPLLNKDEADALLKYGISNINVIAMCTFKHHTILIKLRFLN